MTPPTHPIVLMLPTLPMQPTPYIPPVRLGAILQHSDKLMKFPKISIKKGYFIYLLTITIVSLLLHEVGHALAILAAGGRIISYELIRVKPDPNFPTDNPFIPLGGAVVTSLVCFFATYKIFEDKNNSNIWLATIFSNFRPLILLILYLAYTPQDEIIVINQFKIHPVVFFVSYFLIFSLPLLVLIKSPKLPPGKKIVFYLYNIAIIILVINILSTLNAIIF
jgi:hypothetical protein